MELELKRLNIEKAVSENIAAINEDGRQQNQAAAMQDAGRTRKDKGKQARKQRGKTYRS